MSSPSELIAAASNGDREAFSRLLVLYDGELRRWLAGKIDVRFRSLLSEDDVLQETHMEAYTSIGNFKGDNESGFLNWLKTIARHNMLDGLKALRTARRGGQELRGKCWIPTNRCLNLLDMLSDSSETPSARLSALRELKSFTKLSADFLNDINRLL